MINTCKTRRQNGLYNQTLICYLITAHLEFFESHIMRDVLRVINYEELI